MNMGFKVAILAVLTNTGYVGLMYLAQQIDVWRGKMPKRHSIIAGTNQRFLYMTDWHVLWGDYFSLSLIHMIFLDLVWNEKISPLQWQILGTVAVADLIIFLCLCLLPSHKSDQGYPAPGKISLNGLLHLPYHGYFVGVTALVFWHLALGNLEWWPILTFSVGVLSYAFCFAEDLRIGNFDKIKTI